MLVLVLGRTTRVGMLMGVLMLMFMAMIVLAFHRVSSVFPSGAETSLGDPMLSRSEDRGDRI
jgi:hypothetical protein